MSRPEQPKTAQAVALCLKGMPLREAAQWCSVDVSTIVRALKRAGVARRPAGRPPKAKKAAKPEQLPSQKTISPHGLAMREAHDRAMREIFDAVWAIKIPPLTATK